MSFQLRNPVSSDLPAISDIIYRAFSGIADKHNFPHDFPSSEAAAGLTQMCVEHPKIYGVVAEQDGKVIGSNFLWEFDDVGAVGPITIDPNVQGTGVGRSLMQDVVERGKNFRSIRLVQSAYNTVSMSLYTSLGFDIKEPLVQMQGTPRTEILNEGIEVRAMREEDFESCDALHQRAHRVSRLNELKQLKQMFPAVVAARNGRITAYASASNFWQMNHAVAETNEDMQALLAGAAQITKQPLSFLLPSRQSELFRWSLANGLRVIQPMSLMSMGEYQEPKGAFLPSVLY